MDFGSALQALKSGAQVYRLGWNGKRMFIFPEGTQIDYRAHIDMKTADGSIVPWVASQTDLLAEDWELV